MAKITIPEKMAPDFEERIHAYIQEFVGEPGKRTWGECLERLGDYIRMGYAADITPINVVAAYIVAASILEEAAEYLYKAHYNRPAETKLALETTDTIEVTDDSSMEGKSNEKES